MSKHTKIKEYWDIVRYRLTVPTQERIRNRVVLLDWDLENAVRNEGVIPPKHRKLDLSVAKELFEKGELPVSKVEKRKDIEVKVLSLNKKTQVAEQMGVDKAKEGEDKTVETVYEKTDNGFIPRPKVADCGVKDPKVLCRQPQCASCDGKERSFIPRPKPKTMQEVAIEEKNDIIKK